MMSAIPRFAIAVWPLFALLAVASFGRSTVRAAEPLHVRIDQQIAAAAKNVPLQPASGDAEFARRISLDLAGRIPTRQELQAFLDDSSVDKREQWIDRLLGSDDYPRRMQELFHTMLMERRGDNPDWLTFLRTSFESNRRWDEFVRAIVRPNAESEADRGAAFFYTQRLVSEGAMAPVDVPGLTRDFGRLFAGVDLQCAQCHDHLSVDQYKQRDFQGLHVIFENVQTVGGSPFPAIGEKVMTARKEFMSVFTQVPMQTGPVVPGGSEIEIVTFEKGQEFAVGPDPKLRTPGVPKFSPLAELARQLPSAENTLFCRNIVNRLWFVMFGRGLVEPLDLLHKDNPPTHPELLDLLAGEFAGNGFDVKWLLRELALTAAYQRTSVIPAGPLPEPATYAVAHEKRLSAEQIFWSLLIATGEARRLQSADEAQAKADAPAPQSPLEQLVSRHAHLKALQKLAIDAFANPPQEPEVDFEPSVKGALFLMNDVRVLKLLERQPGNLVDRLAQLESDDQVANELFLSVLSRAPSEVELRDVTEYLKENAAQRDAALGFLAWALLTTTEFCVNH